MSLACMMCGLSCIYQSREDKRYCTKKEGDCEYQMLDVREKNPGRLTEKDEQGNWMLKGVPWKSLHEGQIITKGMWERLYGALWKLMEYEDTGLSPEDIKYAEWALSDAAEELEEFHGGETNLVGEIKELLAKFN